MNRADWVRRTSNSSSDASPPRNRMTAAATLNGTARLYLRPSDNLARVKYICESCGYIYDPEEGDLDGGIPAGTAFEDIPETWFCPVCGARKADFTPWDD